MTPIDLARAIVAREGGFVNDPADPGGATNHGVTIHTMRRLGLDLDRDGDVDVADVRRVTPDLAVEVYLRHYFREPGIDRLPESVQAQAFDFYVNAGNRAIKVLQEVLTDAGFGPLNPDGSIGKLTIAAATKADDAMRELLADAYAIARRSFYYRLADGRPSLRKFAKRRDGGKGGWITRAEEFMRSHYRLTDAQHRARVAAWR